MKEVEVKILEIDKKKILRILKSKKAKRVKKVFQQNFVYANDYTISKDVIVRIRKEGKNVFLTVKGSAKFVKGQKIREEFEEKIKSFEKAEKMLSLMGFKIISINDIKREYFLFEGCSVEICEMPKIPVYLEIEGSPEKIDKVAKAFGYSKKDYFGKYVLKHYGIKDKFLRFGNGK